MHERLSMTVRIGVILSSMILVADCNDAPLAPRRKPSQVTEVGAFQAFTGRRADSVIRAFDAVWARSSHPDHRLARQAWRKANGIPDSIDDPGITPVPFVPNDVLTSGDGSLRPPPQILSHFEALHFGHVDQYTNVPDGLEADVTFIGDQAESSAGSIIITKKDGSIYPVFGTIAQGSGQLISCTDLSLGTCNNRRLLNGVMVLSAAPTCDASGGGTVNYYASNLNSSLSITGISGSGGSQTATGTGSVSSSASACPRPDTTSHTSDSTTTSGPVGDPSGSPPDPTEPNVPLAPPPPPPVVGPVVSFHCERGDIYVNGALWESKITCYPDQARISPESGHVL